MHLEDRVNFKLYRVMKTTTLLIFTVASIWLANAKPFPPQELASVLSKDAVIELLSKFSEEMDNAEVTGDSDIEWPDKVDPPSFEKPGRLQSSDSEDIDWPDKVDPPSFEKPGLQSNGEEGTPKKDEEKINEESGISKRPNVYGDLVLSPKQKEMMESDGEGNTQAMFAFALRWPNGVIPYTINMAFPLHGKAMAVIHEAMNEIAQKSCIKFVLRTVSNWHLYPNFVHFFPGQGCYSGLGMTGGPQIISIGPGCETKAIVQHEILHALGRIHEQSRPDRDQYVYINYFNVKPDQRHNFDKLPAYPTQIPYDYSSLMHYGRDAFSILEGTLNPAYDTVIPTDPRAINIIGQRQGLSYTDWEHIRLEYCSPPFNSERQTIDQNDA